MKHRASEVGTTVWYSLVVVIAFVVIETGLFAWNAAIYPWWLQVQRAGVEQSKSYTDSSNDAMMTYIQDYNKPSASDGQKQADINAICLKLSQMQVGTASPIVTQFISLHGGCR